MRTTAPYQLKAWAQARPRHVAAQAGQPARTSSRVRTRRPARRQKRSAAPTRARGHHPKGGSERASRSPAASEGSGHRGPRRRQAGIEPGSERGAPPPGRWPRRPGCPRPGRRRRPRPRRRARATAASMPATRKRWCTRYWGKASAHRVTTTRPWARRSTPSERVQLVPPRSRPRRRSSRRPGVVRSARPRPAAATSPSGPGAATSVDRKVQAVTAHGLARPGAGCAAGTRSPVPWRGRARPRRRAKVTRATEA